MSLQSLRNIQDSYAAEDRWIAGREKSRDEKRKEVLLQEEIVKRGEILLKRVIKKVNESCQAETMVRCELRPNCVFDYVVQKIKEKGWSAKHSWNDGFNDYDFIKVKAPKL